MSEARQKSPVPEVPAAQAVHHEWRTAENSALYLLPKLRSMVEHNPKLSLLDVGAGSGTVTASLAKLMPDGRVVGIDKNEGILPRARANAESIGVDNVEFRVGDTFDLPFEDNTFDVTHCHQVLCHLKEPDKALREFLRVTKPGGIVAAREGDYETECFWPEIPGLVKFHKFVAAALAVAGGAANGGRQLIAWALKAGVKRDHIAASYSSWCYITPEDKRIWGESLARIRELGS
jgi:SAM-dependent methyltransferase